MAGEGLLYLSPADLKAVVPLSPLDYLIQDQVAGSICQASKLFHSVGIPWLDRIFPQEKNGGLLLLHRLSPIFIDCHPHLSIAGLNSDYHSLII